MGDGLEMKLLNTEELHPPIYNDVLEERTSVCTISLDRFTRWPYMGITLASISSFFFSLCSVIVQWIKDVSPFELAVFRFLGILLLSLPILIWSNVEIFPKGKRLMLVLRSIVGATALTLSFYAFRNMHLADASVIVFSVPVFVSIFARIFLKEPCGMVNAFSIFLVLIGVVLITKPIALFGDDNDIKKQNDCNKTMGIAAAFVSTLFGASAYVLLRTLKSLHFSVVMVNFGFFALIETLIITVLTNSLSWPVNLTDRILIVALCVFSFMGQVLLTLAFKIENAGPISVARTSDIVFAFIWQILFFQQVPNVYSIIGAVYVVGSVLIIALRKWVISLPNNDPRKIKLLFLTK